MKNKFTMSQTRRGKSFSSVFPVRNRLVSLVCCLVMLSGTAVYAQQPTYDVDYQNRSVISILEDLRTRTGFLFLHQDGVISNSDRVSVRLEKATLPQILDKVLTENGYRYRIDGNDVIITRGSSSTTQPAQSQQSKTVTGKVTDAQRQPMVGVTVVITGENRGVVTDQSGNYSIEVIPGQMLEFSYLGMRTHYVRFSNQDTINPILQEEITEIEQAVVIGYGSARAVGSVVGSVETIGGDNFEYSPVVNFSDLLQGQVSGLSVLSSSGEPSAAASIRLRGVNSMSAVITPLYILDGAPVNEQVFNSLNASNIENIVVLKDASATAIYGSRAANGVIAITTKKGRMNQDAVVSVKASYGISQITGDKVTMMNSEQYIQFREMLNPAITKEDDWQRHKQVVLENGISTDWKKEVYRNNAPTHNVDATISGGGEKVSYYIGLNQNGTQGIAPTSEMNRIALHSNIESIVRNWLRVGLKTNVAWLKYNQNPDTGGTSYINPAAFVRMARPDDSPWYYTVDNDGKAIFGDRADYLHQSQFLIPRFVEDVRYRKRENLTLMANLFQEVRPVDGLIFRAVQALDLFDYSYSSNNRPVPDFITPMGDQVIYNGGEGAAAESFQRYYSFTFTNTLEYKLHAGDRHHTTFLIGQEAILTKDRSFGATFTGHTDKRLMLLSQGTDYSPPTHAILERVFNSAFARVDYNFDYKYFLDLTYRVDGSSKFGPNNRWAEFYSVGGMWNLKQEEFLAQNNWVNDLSVRLSYGTTGNAGIPDYLFYGLVGASNIVYQGENGTTNAQAGNPNLSWETVTTFNAGVDFRLFDGKLYGSAEFYRKKTTDMLMAIPYSFTTGYGNGVGNIGGMTNTGVDLALRSDLIRKGDFYWEVHANLNYNKNKITELFNGLNEYVLSETGLKLQVGKSYGQYFIVRRQGVDPRDGKQIWLDKYGNETKVYSDDHAVFVNKKQYAPFSGGFGTMFRYKTLSLRADFAFALGKYALNNDLYFMENAYEFGASRNQSVRMLNMWTTPGQRTDIPAATELLYADDHLLENASFMRLKTLQLTYSLPEKWMNSTNFFRRASVFAVARNLFTITNYSGLDPEPDDNVIRFSYPNTRQYVFGIELYF